jgi:glycosyltransferase involved in cell wall biosynthesis
MIATGEHEITDRLPQQAAGAKPAVSWLMCTHVADEQLREALQSCLAQTFSDFECVLVVNGSAAESVASTVRSWYGHDIRMCVYTTEVKHLTFSLALGLHLARAPLVARMDSDDIATPDRLARQVEFMPNHDTAIRKALLRGNPLCHPSVMFRRETILAAGGYLGGIYAQDYDLWARLAVNPETRFANLPHVCLRYRMVGVGTARKARLAYASMAAAQYRNFAAGAGLRWALAALITTAKAILRSLPAANC